MLRIAFASLLAGLLALLAPSAAAAGYPEKPIRLLVPFAPGGGTDLLCRALQDKLDRAFGVSVIIDNRAGAGGTIGVTLAARAAPDCSAIDSSFMRRAATMANSAATNRAFMRMSTLTRRSGTR